MTAGELEEFIFEFEEIRVIFRVLKSQILPIKKYERSLGGDMTVKQFLKRYSVPEIPMVIVDGKGSTTHLPQKTLETIRSSYNLG